VQNAEFRPHFALGCAIFIGNSSLVGLSDYYFSTKKWTSGPLDLNPQQAGDTANSSYSTQLLSPFF